MAWLYKRPDSEKWWIGYRANGKQFLRSTKTENEAEAKKQLASVNAMFTVHESQSLTQEVYEVLTGKVVPRKTLHAEIEDWLTESATTTKAGTLRRYRAIMDDFKTHFAASDKGPLLSEVETEQIRSYLMARMAKASASTANLERKILRMLFKRATENSTLKINPMLPIKQFKGAVAKHTRRAFTLKEFRDLLKKAPNDFWRYMILGGIYTGLRLGDLVTLDWASVDFSEGVLRVMPIKTSGTTGKTVHIPMHSSLRVALEKLWLAQRRPTKGPIWPEHAARYRAMGANKFSNEFYDIMAKCGIVPHRDDRNTKAGRGARRAVNAASFHCFRHTFVTLLKIAGTSGVVAQELSGHSSASMNQIYTHLPMETLTKAIAQLPEVTK